MFKKNEAPYLLTDNNPVKTEEIRDTQYFMQHINSQSDFIQKARTNKLVPPNAVRMTEQDEQRLKEFENKMMNEIQKSHTKHFSEARDDGK